MTITDLPEASRTEGRDPVTLVPDAVEEVLRLAGTWLAWDGSPRYGDGNVWTPHKALLRVGDDLLDHLAATNANADFVFTEWDRCTRADDIDRQLEPYTQDARFESPLVARILDPTSGVLRGHDQLREFFERGTHGRPEELVRFWRTGRSLFNGHTLSWEYPARPPTNSTSSNRWPCPGRSSPTSAPTGAGQAPHCSSHRTPGQAPPDTPTTLVRRQCGRGSTWTIPVRWPSTRGQGLCHHDAHG